jgi:uncharacterized repeat protein (TIGR03803 family)
MNRFDSTRILFAALLLAFVSVRPSPAQTFTSLFSFSGNNGANPQYGSLVQGSDGDLYGTTGGGGAHHLGTVFKMTPAGSLIRLHSFAGPDGATPTGGVIEGTDGKYYGTTLEGGANGSGTIFTITGSGTFTTLYNFCSLANCADGATPAAGLFEGTDGSFYGTTEAGGIDDNGNGGTICNYCGTLFKITSAGVLTTLYDFCALRDCPDGAIPYGPLFQSSNGNFYGTTGMGGTEDNGTVFELTPSGTLTTLHEFVYYIDGQAPYGALIQGSDGNLYGTTALGGFFYYYGSIFEINSSNNFSSLYSFSGPDGWAVYAGLVQATDGNFYGTTDSIGTTGYGTVFVYTPAGTLTTLHTFSGSDGGYSHGTLVQATNGLLYGTTTLGGAHNDGTVFSLDLGLGPFVKPLPVSGSVGQAIRILGTNLTGATAVTFNGTAASFTVVAPSLIRATVPAGATTGTIQVTTPSGTLSSNVAFIVN